MARIKTGTTIKRVDDIPIIPTSVNQFGVVSFTDGINIMPPNQIQCEKFGYTFNRAKGVCEAFKYSTTLNGAFNNISNTLKGSGNQTYTNTINSDILGINNLVKGKSRNTQIVGNNNEIENGVNNTIISGSFSSATATNSTVLGGNIPDDPADVLGDTEVVGGDFSNPTDWLVGNGVTVSNRLLTSTNVSGTQWLAVQNNIQAIPVSISYSFTVSDYVAGDVKLIFKGVSSTTVTANGTYTGTLVIPLTKDQSVGLYTIAGFGGSIQNLIINENIIPVSKRQSTHLMYGVRVDQQNWRPSWLNNQQNEEFNIPNNTVMYFHADILAVRVGGSSASGSVGDFASWVERGVIRNSNGVMSIQRERDTIKSSGVVTGWLVLSSFNGTNFRLSNRGAVDMIIDFASDIKFTEIKTGINLS